MKMKKTHAIYLANLFFGFHYALTLYVNSSYLLRFVNEKTLSLLYVAGALLNIVLLSVIPKIIKKVETKPLALTVAILQFITIYNLSNVSSPLSAGILFIIQQGLGLFILYTLDLFLEAAMTDEKNTGRMRAFFVTSLNIAVLASFFVLSRIIEN